MKNMYQHIAAKAGDAFLGQLAENETIIGVDDVYKSFGDNHVLRGVSFQVQRSETVVVLGKSGSGKSVLLKCMVGLVQPDKGRIKVFDRDIISLSQDELDLVRARVGFVFQNNALYDSMTIRQNLEFLFHRHRIRINPKELDERVMTALTDVGLPHTVDMMPAQLSGGMRKRIALARSLVMKPEIMLYDEPTTGLDPITAHEIEELIASMQSKYNITSVIISHDMSCIKRFPRHLVMLIDGKCRAEGELQSLLQSQDPQVKAFFQGENHHDNEN